MSKTSCCTTHTHTRTPAPSILFSCYLVTYQCFDFLAHAVLRHSHDTGPGIFLSRLPQPGTGAAEYMGERERRTRRGGRLAAQEKTSIFLLGVCVVRGCTVSLTFVLLAWFCGGFTSSLLCSPPLLSSGSDDAQMDSEHSIRWM